MFVQLLHERPIQAFSLGPFASAHAVEPELRQGALAEVRVSPPLPGLILHAVVAPDALGSAVVDDLLDSLRGSPKK
jgi:hypothetical protein